MSLEFFCSKIRVYVKLLWRKVSKVEGKLLNLKSCLIEAFNTFITDCL